MPAGSPAAGTQQLCAPWCANQHHLTFFGDDDPTCYGGELHVPLSLEPQQLVEALQLVLGQLAGGGVR
ncbi:hypothetical protein [uncultured Jatrophihabitans sp.]|uniref:hypothetical protein n=1 Tax=uncultured Jatrophihabitans sp. TaxID=1610747 RepID=UPI0035CC2A2D